MTSGGWANSSYTKISSMSDLKKGDVVCFKGHVALYMGGGQIIDASSSQGKVRITSINSSYWKRTFILRSSGMNLRVYILNY
jgi:cell wall-associated NlpC family hydrolase